MRSAISGHQLALDAAHHLGARLLLRECRDALQLGGDQTPLILDGLPKRLELGLATCQPLLVGFELPKTALEALLALIGPLLLPRNLGAALANLGLRLVATARGFLLCGKEHGLRLLLRDAQLIKAPFSVSVMGVAHLGDASTRIHESGSRKRGRNNHQPYQGDDLDADGMEPRRSGAMRPAWNASSGERDRDETHIVSLLRSGPARDWPVVHHVKTFTLYEPAG